MIPALKHAERKATVIGDYRYDLTRYWGPQTTTVVWVMLNPSTADGIDDDRTVNKIMTFSYMWGYGGLEVVNLYAYRATRPEDLMDAQRAGVDIIGDDTWVDGKCRRADLVMCGWGANVDSIEGGAERARTILGRIRDAGKVPHVLRTTKSGHPQHPLYLPYELVPARLA